MKTVHLFGEMDLDLSMSRDKIYKEAGRIAEACGYAGHQSKDVMTLLSQDYDIVKIKFEYGKVSEVRRSIDEGKIWETLNCKDNIFEVDRETLKKYSDQIEYNTQQRLPLAQGMMMNEIAKEYKINSIRWGYHFDHIGLETTNQFLLWRDCGTHAEFMGIINKDGSTPK